MVACLSLKGVDKNNMKIAVIGQSLFGQEVYKELRREGHTVVGVFTIPDKDGKPDPLGEPRDTLISLPVVLHQKLQVV